MPAVVTYWQLPDEEKDFLDYLQKTDSVMAMADHWGDLRGQIAPQTLAQFIEENNPKQLAFTLEAFVSQVDIETQMVDGRILYGISLMKSCLIGYRRGNCRNDKLTLSTLSAYFKYPNIELSGFIEKDQEFVRWVKKVMSWVRKSAPEKIEYNGYSYRATKRVKQAVCDGELDVTNY